DEGGEQAQDAEPYAQGLLIGLHEFVVFQLHGVDHPDDGGAQDALIDHFVQGVDDLSAFQEEGPYFLEHHEKGDPDDGYDRNDDESQLPVDAKQQDAGADDDDKAAGDGYDGLGDEHFNRVDIRREIGQQFRGSGLLQELEALAGYFFRQAGTQ